MPGRAVKLQSFKRAYDLHLSVKCVTLLLLFGAILVLARIEGGFPPAAWRILAAAIPQFPNLVAVRGSVELLPIAGLLILSVTWASLWLALLALAIALLWRAWFPARYARRQAKSWRRTSLDDLRDFDFDEPQASLAYAAARSDCSAPASFEKVASSVYADISTRPGDGHAGASGQGAYVPGARANTPGTKADVPGRSRGSPLPYTRQKPTDPSYRVGATLAVALDGNSTPATRPATRPLSRPPAAHTRPLTPGNQKPPMGEQISQPPSRPSMHAPSDAGRKLGIGWDVGLKRKGKPNEDSVLALQSYYPFRGELMPLSLYAVADGMGGNTDGQVASHLATHSLLQTTLPAIQHGEALTEEFLIDTMVDCARWANHAVYQYRQEHGIDLGTTLTAALVVPTMACIVNVGDSRAYLYRPGRRLRQVTRDHSLVARLLAAGIISAEEVYTHPDRNKVYRALGEKEEVQVDWFIEPLQPGDSLLLCSDGVWELVRDHEIEKILRVTDAAQAADALVMAAIYRGSHDNISAIVAHV